MFAAREVPAILGRLRGPLFCRCATSNPEWCVGTPTATGVEYKRLYGEELYVPSAASPRVSNSRDPSIDSVVLVASLCESPMWNSQDRGSV